MSDNPSKLTVGLLEEANFPTWRPAMEARLRQLGVFRIVTGERTEPEEPDYVEETPATATAAAIPLTREERALNAQLKSAYERELNEFKDRQEKAAGDILAHLSRSQRTHVVNCHDDPAKMWATIKAVHVQQVPGMCFSTYNDLFSIVKGPEETLPAVASCVEEAIARVVELRPAQITEVAASPSGGSAQITRAYNIGDLDNELALMTMLCSLPREEYTDFVSLLMRQKDLTRADVEAAFQVEQTKHDAHRGPLLPPSGDTALHTTAQAPRVNKPGIKCGFCTGDGHTERRTATRRSTRAGTRRRSSRSAALAATAARRRARTAPPPPLLPCPRRPMAPRSPSSPPAQVSALLARPTRTLMRTGSQTRALHLI
jgi:hypothetical protein